MYVSLIPSSTPSRPDRHGLECLLSVVHPTKARQGRRKPKAESRTSLGEMLEGLRKRSYDNRSKPFDSGMPSTPNVSTVEVQALVRSAACQPLPSWDALWEEVWNLRRSSRAVNAQTQWWVNSFGIHNLYHIRSANLTRCVECRSQCSFSNALRRLPGRNAAPPVTSGGVTYRALHI